MGWKEARTSQMHIVKKGKTQKLKFLSVCNWQTTSYNDCLYFYAHKNTRTNTQHPHTHIYICICIYTLAHDCNIYAYVGNARASLLLLGRHHGNDNAHTISILCPNISREWREKMSGRDRHEECEQPICKLTQLTIGPP